MIVRRRSHCHHRARHRQFASVVLIEGDGQRGQVQVQVQVTVDAFELLRASRLPAAHQRVPCTRSASSIVHRVITCDRDHRLDAVGRAQRPSQRRRHPGVAPSTSRPPPRVARGWPSRDGCAPTPSRRLRAAPGQGPPYRRRCRRRSREGRNLEPARQRTSRHLADTAVATRGSRPSMASSAPIGSSVISPVGVESPVRSGTSCCAAACPHQVGIRSCERSWSCRPPGRRRGPPTRSGSAPGAPRGTRQLRKRSES